MTMRLKKFNLRWEGDLVPNDEEVEKTIIDLNLMLDNLDDACSLITHTVALTDDMSGPSVHVYGKDGDRENLYAAYSLTTNWITIGTEDNE